MSNIEKEQAICESCETRPCYYACDKILSERLRDAVDELIELKQQIAILLHPQLRNSSFDFNARYLHFDEAQQIPEFQDITKALENAKNFEPWPVGNFTFYRRGTGGLWLYVVPTCDFRVPRERKSHKVEVAILHHMAIQNQDVQEVVTWENGKSQWVLTNIYMG